MTGITDSGQAVFNGVVTEDGDLVFGSVSALGRNVFVFWVPEMNKPQNLTVQVIEY